MVTRPLGMVESALEFLRICEDLHYHDIVLSMKASNPQVMIQAYRVAGTKVGRRGVPTVSVAPGRYGGRRW